MAVHKERKHLRTAYIRQGVIVIVKIADESSQGRNEVSKRMALICRAPVKKLIHDLNGVRVVALGPDRPQRNSRLNGLVVRNKRFNLGHFGFHLSYSECVRT